MDTGSITNNLDSSIMTLIFSTDPVGKLVIFILILSSIWSWGIIFNKLITLKKIKSNIIKFENLFWSGQVLDDLYEKVKKSVDNPLASVFVQALNECKKHKASKHNQSDIVRIGYKDRIVQAMYLAKNREVEALESRIGFLATVGSSAPFIGLLGTVWGIMHSFQSIAASKNTSLAVVAPGIAEALFATAIGLFAAIPAVIFYNFLVGSIDKIDNKIDDFIGELTALLTRAIDEEQM